MLWVLLPALGFIALLAVAAVGEGGPPRPGEPAPAFSAPLLDGGGSLTLSQLRGRPVLLNFWASWCVPCKEEAGMLRRAHRTYGDEVAFVGVDIKDAKTDALKFVERERLFYQHVRDEQGAIYDDYGLTGQPETFLIDENGVVVEHVNGPFVHVRDLFALLDVLVARSS